MSDLQTAGNSAPYQPPPVFNPIPELASLRPPDVRGLLTPPVNWGANILPGMQQGLDMGKSIAQMPLFGKQLQVAQAQAQLELNKGIPAQSAKLDTELALQQQGQQTLNNPTVQQYAPGTTSFSPGGGVSRGPVPLSPLMMGGLPPAAPGAQAGSAATQVGGDATQPPPISPAHPGVQLGKTPAFTPDDVKSWYVANVGNNVKHVEMDPQGRGMVTLTDGRVQPVHPAYMAANLGNWQPKLQDPNMANGTPADSAHPAAGITGGTIGASMNRPVPSPQMAQDPNAVAQATQQAVGANTANAINPPAAPAPEHPLTTLQKSGFGLPAAFNDDPKAFYTGTGLNQQQASEVGQAVANPNIPSPSGLKAMPNIGDWHGPSVTAPNGGQIYFDPSSKLPYYIKGKTDTEEQRQYMDGSQPQMFQIPKQYQPNQKINDLIADQGFGDATKMSDDERDAAYRQAMAKQDYLKKPEMPESSAARMEFTREATTQAVQLQKTISQMSPTDRDAMAQSLNQITQTYGPRLQASGIVDQVKKTTGVDLNQSNPNLVKMIQQYGTLKDLIAEGKARAGLKDVERDTLTNVLGDPKLKDFPDNLNRFIGTLGSSLSMQIDHGLSQNWKMPQSAVNEANLVQHNGVSGLPGSMKASPIQVNSQQDYDKQPLGTWVVGASGIPKQKF